MRPIVVLGAGSWGTALAIQFARGGGPTVLWGRAEDEPEKIARERENVRYLPGAKFPPALAIEPDLRRALAQGDDVVLVVPSSVLRAVLQEIKPHLPPKARVAWASKGFELSTGKLPHQVASEVLGPGVPVAVLSGPTFAKEVGQGLPTAIAVASSDVDFARSLAERISSGGFRAYTQTDIVGVEIGGAVKNVLAIATGCSDGLGYGSNSRVFLITRGLAELMRLGVALGANRETLMGLAGLGDLVLTCTDDQSRNRRFGRALAAGKPVEQAIAEIGQVVEGYHAAKAVHEVAQRLGVDMPICRHVYEVLHEGVPLEQVVKGMLARAVTPEN
jgi:glycerol-3-phosphate dehydrogenase (NAD(P)+)